MHAVKVDFTQSSVSLHHSLLGGTYPNYDIIEEESATLTPYSPHTLSRANSISCFNWEEGVRGQLLGP